MRALLLRLARAVTLPGSRLLAGLGGLSAVALRWRGARRGALLRSGGLGGASAGAGGGGVHHLDDRLGRVRQLVRNFLQG